MKPEMPIETERNGYVSQVLASNDKYGIEIRFVRAGSAFHEIIRKESDYQGHKLRGESCDEGEVLSG